MVEDRDEVALAAQLAMVGDGEAVRLIADALDEVERLAVARQHDRVALALAEHELELLGEADDGDVRMTRAPDDLKRRGELPLAAVDDNEIRQLLLWQIAVAALRDLAHGEEVVRLSLRAFDLEAPVVGFLRHATLEDDHRGNGLSSLNMRDIEALHAVRRLLEAEVAAELLDGPERLCVRLRTARLLI